MALKRIGKAITTIIFFYGLYKLMMKKAEKVIHQVEQTLPGKGINPILVQQPVPQKAVKNLNGKKDFVRATIIK